MPGEAAAASPASPAAPARATLPVRQIVWLAGTVVCGAGIACLYMVNYKRFRRAVPVENESASAWLDAHPLRRPLAVRALDSIDSPLTYGVLRPVILVPEGFDFADEAARYALEHEYVHARRLDAAFKLALAAALAVHWFNPAVWLMYVLANRDIELSCDEAVLRRFGEGERGAYARALLSMEEKRSALPALYAGFGANPTKERILAIMKFKKASVLSLALAAALVLALAACAATGTNAQDTAEKITNETDAAILGVAENIGETPQDAAASAARLYVNDGLQLSVPLEYADLLLVETPQDDEWGTLFIVSEKASVEAAKAAGHDDWGMGWLFSIERVSKAELDEWMTADMSGVSVFAKDADGNCYIRSMPTDVRYYRDEDAVVEESDGWAQWETLQRWAGTVRGTFLAENSDLTPFTVTNPSVDIYIARLACLDDIEYTLSSTAFGPLPPDGVDAAPYVARLRNNVTFGGADSAETPEGEYFSLFFPDGSGGERFDFFAAGGNYVREVYGTNGEYEFLYKATYTDGTTRAGDIMQKWYMALAAANGIVPQASSPLLEELEPVDPPAESPVWSAGSPDK
ncbi:MAG: M56 family metallopeptidase, partial [Oscillospiraceae bacterium]|nr:M56 family metallopeptidase [Oscillospiraceae bacterium]